MRLRLASSSYGPALSFLRLLTCNSSRTMIMVGCAVVRFPKAFFHNASVCSRISRAFVIFWSQFLITLLLSSMIDCSRYDCWSTFNYTLSPSNLGSSESLSV